MRPGNIPKIEHFARPEPIRNESGTPRIRDAPPRDSLLAINNACCGRRCTSAAVDFRLRAQVRSPRFGPRSQPRESNPGPSYRCSRSHGVRPLGQAGPSGSGFCLHNTFFFLALTIQYNRFWAEPFIKRSLALVQALCRLCAGSTQALCRLYAGPIYEVKYRGSVHALYRLYTRSVQRRALRRALYAPYYRPYTHYIAR